MRRKFLSEEKQSLGENAQYAAQTKLLGAALAKSVTAGLELLDDNRTG